MRPSGSRSGSDPAPPSDRAPVAAAATVIYRADLSTGTYNHGPRIIRHGGLFVVSWYAGQQDEDAGGERVLFSTALAP